MRSLYSNYPALVCYCACAHGVESKIAHGEMSEELEFDEKTFLLPDEVQFGYLPVCSSHIEVYIRDKVV